MKDEVRFEYNNGKTCIAYKSTSIANVMSKKHTALSPLNIKVVNGLQLELGRNIEDYIDVLKKTRIPITIRKYFASNGIGQYIISRMNTGRIDDYQMAYVVCRDNRIMAISLNDALLLNVKFRRFVGISLVFQVGLEGNNEEAYRMKLGTVLGVEPSKLKIEIKPAEVDAYIKKGDCKIKYTLIKKTPTDIYRMASVSLIE